MSEMEEEDVSWDSDEFSSLSVELKTKRICFLFSFSLESVVGTLGQRKRVEITSPKYFSPREVRVEKGSHSQASVTSVNNPSTRPREMSQ